MDPLNTTEAVDPNESPLLIELVDGQNNVISQATIPASAFPITMRLVDGKSPASAHVITGNIHKHTTPHTHATATVDDRIPRWVAPPAWAWGIVVATVALFLLQTYLSTYDKFAGTTVYAVAIGTIAMMSLWAAGWAVYGRISRGHAHFRSHLAWASLWSTVFIIIGGLVSLQRFLLPTWSTLNDILGLAGGVCAVIALHGHFTMASSMRREHRWLATVAVGGCIAILAGIGRMLAEDDYETSLKYDTVIFPIDSRWIPAQSVEALPDKFGEMEKALVKEVAKASDPTGTGERR